MPTPLQAPSAQQRIEEIYIDPTYDSIPGQTSSTFDPNAFASKQVAKQAPPELLTAAALDSVEMCFEE